MERKPTKRDVHLQLCFVFFLIRIKRAIQAEFQKFGQNKSLQQKIEGQVMGFFDGSCGLFPRDFIDLRVTREGRVSLKTTAGIFSFGNPQKPSFVR